jgi:hypothetical protein
MRTAPTNRRSCASRTKTKAYAFGIGHSLSFKIAHSVGANARRISPLVTQMVSAERAADLRNRCLSLPKGLPIGFRSVERRDVAVATVDGTFLT